MRSAVSQRPDPQAGGSVRTANYSKFLADDPVNRKPSTTAEEDRGAERSQSRAYS